MTETTEKSTAVEGPVSPTNAFGREEVGDIADPFPGTPHERQARNIVVAGGSTSSILEGLEHELKGKLIEVLNKSTEDLSPSHVLRALRAVERVVETRAMEAFVESALTNGCTCQQDGVTKNTCPRESKPWPSITKSWPGSHDDDLPF